MIIERAVFCVDQRPPDPLPQFNRLNMGWADHVTLSAGRAGINIGNKMFHIFFGDRRSSEKTVKKIILFAKEDPPQTILGREDLFELSDLGRG